VTGAPNGSSLVSSRAALGGLPGLTTRPALTQPRGAPCAEVLLNAKTVTPGAWVNDELSARPC
jgi:hypothetical protein